MRRLPVLLLVSLLLPAASASAGIENVLKSVLGADVASSLDDIKQIEKTACLVLESLEKSVKKGEVTPGDAIGTTFFTLATALKDLQNELLEVGGALQANATNAQFQAGLQALAKSASGGGCGLLDKLVKKLNKRVAKAVKRINGKVKDVLVQIGKKVGKTPTFESRAPQLGTLVTATSPSSPLPSPTVPNQLNSVVTFQDPASDEVEVFFSGTAHKGNFTDDVAPVQVTAIDDEETDYDAGVPIQSDNGFAGSVTVPTGDGEPQVIVANLVDLSGASFDRFAVNTPFGD